ncbi:oligoendopeptidase F [Candidatus Izimaplasma bacterium ZiA1]|uniref:M3 family oligoendopeptidase n=1 Tax=Candidatus Izimoplasma sp. ZiA1 TaxID=2024899 RepID=UPI000BAA7EBB|nr:oligoendopeptidase F [Candidatus Izimaplasma bacterium ZiA1]
MKFNDYKYQRPDIEQFKKDMDEQLQNISQEKPVNEEIKAIYNVFKIIDEIDSMNQLVGIRNSVDTTDKFYEQEQEFFDENSPYIQEYNQKFINKLLESSKRDDLVKEFGSYIFEKYEIAKKTFSKEIIPELQEENKLNTEYGKLLASAKIEFQGGVYNLSQMRPFTQNKDREVRHQAQLTVSKWFNENEEAIDRIYDEMVKLRTTIAKKLGYKNYVQLGYDRLGRTDYTSEEVKGYRKQVFESVVPFVKELVERKGKRLNIEDLKSYDLALSFLSGNPTPKGDSKWQLNHAKTMYEEMSKETGEFINFMIDKDLLNLDSKPGKQGGGYCTFIPKYESPFIFANFNGTSGDVDVLTHEAGHAFQVYQSQNYIPDYRWPGYEGAEIHSMSMEFLAWPWINKFFVEDTDKYKFDHLAGALSFLPYGVTVDEFQHGIYENPNLSKEERKELWRSIEKKYLPFKDYDDDAFLEKGTFWYRQSHIFTAPFYYIDYTLAQVVAFQYWIKSQSNHSEAFNQYLALCKLGGSKSFLNLLKTAKLENPFNDGVISKTMKPLIKYLNSINDSEL